MILGGLALVITFAVQESRISYHKSKANKWQKRALTHELESRRYLDELKECQSINASNQEKFSTLELEYYKITSQLQTAKKNAEQAVQSVIDSERKSRDKINELQSKIKSNSHCVVSSHNIGLLKAANRQD